VQCGKSAEGVVDDLAGIVCERRRTQPGDVLVRSNEHDIRSEQGVRVDAGIGEQRHRNAASCELVV
jgi:hypothetical protein